MEQFDLKFLQAVNNWQRGGNHKQKVRRGATLKACTLTIDDRFKSCAETCYRQEAHETDRLWNLLAEDKLDETIAAWTLDLSFAQNFKGGVPPPGLQGVIFEITPPVGSVVLNLAELYRDREFLDAIHKYEAEISAYAEGIGKYGASQNEVVLDLGCLAQAHIRQYGGYASSRPELAERHFGRMPTADDLEEFDQLCEIACLDSLGSWWLSPNGTKRVMTRVYPHIDRLKHQKANQSGSE